MEKKEFALWAMALNSYYPNVNPLQQKETVALWYEQLNDLTLEIAELALKKWVATNKWPPTIAEIRETAAEITNGSLPTWGEAWAEVEKAVRMYGHDRPKEALESMRPITRKACECVGFYEICMTENVSNERANFRRIYEELAEREKKENQLPEKLKMLIAKNTNLLEEK